MCVCVCVQCVCVCVCGCVQCVCVGVSSMWVLVCMRREGLVWLCGVVKYELKVSCGSCEVVTCCELSVLHFSVFTDVI